MIFVDHTGGSDSPGPVQLDEVPRLGEAVRFEAR
jgi:hypothetical protein